jgi:phage terminase Nu1 subunit (DNA packaging protein)
VAATEKMVAAAAAVLWNESALKLSEAAARDLAQRMVTAAFALAHIATQGEAASHIDLGERRFRELIEDGALERRPPGEYDLNDVRTIYIRHLRKIAAGRGTKTDADLSTERALLAREQRESAVLRNAQARGELVSIDEVGLQLEAEYGVVRQRLLAIPGKLADALEGLSREEREAILMAEITEALNELHAAADLDSAIVGSDRAIEATAAGSASPEAAAAAQPDRVG